MTRKKFATYTQRIDLHQLESLADSYDETSDKQHKQQIKQWRRLKHQLV